MSASRAKAPRNPVGPVHRTLCSPWWRRTDSGAALLFAAVLALGYACWLFSLTFLRGDGPFWTQENADLTQYISGFNAFVREPWHWPLLRMTSLNAPEGTLVTFLDAVPLYSVILKLLQHGPHTPMRNPYGVWIALCFALQGVGTWWICREARVRSWAALAVLAVLLASFPALTVRIAHISLMAHFLLLFSIAIYLRSSRLGTLASPAWLVLIPCAFYINIYLFAMASAIFMADVIRNLRPGNRWRMLGVCAVLYGLLALSMGITMYPSAKGDATDWGFGYYSMNLLAPFTGGSILDIPRVYPHDGQGEGYNYVGIAVLLVAAYAWYLRRQRRAPVLSRHRPLFIILVLLTVYAVSSVAYFGPVHIYDFSLLKLLGPISGMFRSSGRFFWPVGYMIIVFAVLTVHRYLDRSRSAALLVCLAVFQLADLRDHHKRVRDAIHPATKRIVDEARWNQIFGSETRELLYYPPFRCGKSVPADSLLPTMLYAVKHGMTLSTGYIARARRPCDNYTEEIAERTGPHTGIVFELAAFPDPNEIARLLEKAPPMRCERVDFAYLCRLDRSHLTENKP